MIAVSPNSSVTTIYVDPPTSMATVGENFTIHINISDVSDLYGWEFRLGWNPPILDVVNVTEGPFLKGGGNTFFAPKINNTEGYVLVDCTLLGNGSGVNGSGTLANVKFYAENQGESILDLYNTTLISSQEQTIPHQPIDGYGYFTLPHDVAVTSVTASPIVALSGQPININVTVQNQGSSAEIFNVTAYYSLNVIGTQPVSLGSLASTILNFTWDTTGADKGEYVISAEASVVPGETDTTDNAKEDGTVTIIIPGHDVAIKSVTPSKTIGVPGYSLPINVTAKNYGSFAETFNITAYYNNTPIDTKTVMNLLAGNEKTLTFTWDIPSIPKEYPYPIYVMSANASVVLDEDDTTNNHLSDGAVTVRWPGDASGPTVYEADGRVRYEDLSLMASHWYGHLGYGLGYRPELDFNMDNLIRYEDLSILASYWYTGPLD